MLILLSDGAGLTARQCATVLSRAGHQVEALSPGGLCLCRVTRHVRRVHRVPAIGRDPFGWLDAALDVGARRHAELLLGVQEQVAVMSLRRDRIQAAGMMTAVPDFGALAQVQDKVSAHRTLTRVGVPQPPAVVATTAAELAAAELPAFVKTPIGTASAGVRRVGSRDELRKLAADYERQGLFAAGGGVLVQQPVTGPLVMVQSVFDDGQLVAFLVQALVDVARGRSRPQPTGRPGVRTHQLLLAVLGAAQQGGRRDIARELVNAALRRADYRASQEELTPSRGDPLAALPVAVTALATLVRPVAWQHFTSGSTGAYSLTPAAWAQLGASGVARSGRRDAYGDAPPAVRPENPSPRTEGDALLAAGLPAGPGRAVLDMQWFCGRGGRAVDTSTHGKQPAQEPFEAAFPAPGRCVSRHQPTPFRASVSYRPGPSRYSRGMLTLRGHRGRRGRRRSRA
jgi:hypothetical protein